MGLPNNSDIRTWFHLVQMPFPFTMNTKDLYLRTNMIEVSKNIRFAVESELSFMLIGDVGSGKTTTLSYAISQLERKRFEPIRVIAGVWTFTELLRQCMASLGIYTRSGQQSKLLKYISDSYASIRESGKTPVLCIDEASLLPSDVFQQIHLLSNQSMSCAGKITPIILCGQEALFEKANNVFCKPFMSRVVDGYQLRGLSIQESKDYINHHLYNLCKSAEDIFDENAKIAVAQSSAGIPRKINEICLKAMNIAMNCESHNVTVEHVRKAASNWWEVL